jgi:hypothetical protein
MTLRRFALTRTPAARTTAVLGLLACVGLGVAAANTETLVARHFTAALAATAPQQTAALATAGGPLVSGSEAYWLGDKRRHELQHEAQGALEPATWSATFAAGLSVGDRITVSGGKSERVLEVIAVADVEPAPGQPAASGAAPATHHIAVTCRDLSTPEGRLVTFLTPAGSVTPSAKFRAL